MENFIRHQSLVDQIVQGLEKKILDGTLRPGERMIEDTLCRALGISRSPLREAFRILESMGFVTREPRKGISVAQVTPEEAEDIYLIRASLESLAVHLAVKKRNPKVLEILKHLHKQMAEMAARGNIKAYFDLNLRFHETLTRASENKLLIQLISTFSKQTMRYRLEASSSPGWMKSSIKTHLGILKSFESGDAEKAEEIRKKGVLSHIRRFPAHVRKEGRSED